MESMDQFIGTKAVSERHAFDVGALERHLQRELPGFAGPLAVEQFKGGQSNPTYKLITPQRTYVMRSKPGPVAKLLPSAHAIEREFRVMRALAGSDVPVAQMHLLCDDESVIGRAFYVMQFVEGRVLWEQSLPGFTPRGPRASLRRDEPRDRRAAQRRPGGGGPGGLRQAGQLLRAPDRALVKAVHRVAAASDSRDGSSDRLVARASAAVGARRNAGVDRARRLSPRQPDLRRPSRASPPCSTGSCRRWVIRWPTSATTAWPGTSRPASFAASAGSTSQRSAFRRARVRAPLLRAHRPRRPRRGDGRLELLPRLQPVPSGRDHAGHRQARRRRHCRQRAGPHSGDATQALAQMGWRLRRPLEPPTTRSTHGLRLFGAHAGTAGPPQRVHGRACLSGRGALCRRAARQHRGRQALDTAADDRGAEAQGAQGRACGTCFCPTANSAPA